MAWSVKHFKHYVFGVSFGVVSDHKAPQNLLKASKENETFSNRLTWWEGRIPFVFAVIHEPGRMLGLADFFHATPPTMMVQQ